MVKHVKSKIRSSSQADTTILEEAPCNKCKQPFEASYRALQCNKCALWLHQECTELNEDQYKFLTKKTLSSAIKWFCPICEEKVDTDQVNQNQNVNNNSIDKLANLVLKITEQNAKITEQNAEILQNMKRDMMVEEKLKVNVKEILDSRKDIEDREKCLIYYNVPEEDENEEDDEGEDKRLVTQISNFVYTDPGMEPPFDQGDVSFERLGRKRTPDTDNPSPKPRPIKVFMKDVASRNKILRNAKKLKGSTLSYVGISADKSYEERERDYAIRKVLRTRREAGEDVILYRGEVYLRSEKPWLKNNRASNQATAAAAATPGQ